jgi:hypothetical protein
VQRKADEEAAARMAEIQELATKIEGATDVGLMENNANLFISAYSISQVLFWSLFPLIGSI